MARLRAEVLHDFQVLEASDLSPCQDLSKLENRIFVRNDRFRWVRVNHICGGKPLKKCELLQHMAHYHMAHHAYSRVYQYVKSELAGIAEL